MGRKLCRTSESSVLYSFIYIYIYIYMYITCFFQSFAFICRAPRGQENDPNRKSYTVAFVSDIAKQTLKTNKLRYQVITAFSSTLALYDKLCDCDHYTQSVKMPQLLQIIDKVKKGVATTLARGIGCSWLQS